MARGANNVSYNNIIVDQEGCGIQYYGGTSSNTQAYHNTIVGMRNGPEASGACADGLNSVGGTPQFVNNICYDNFQDFDHPAITPATFPNNWYIGDGNPGFVNYGGGDFHLTAGSPNGVRNSPVAITGVLNVGAINTDYGGPPAFPTPNARDGTPSMGALEYGVAFTPVQGTFYIATNGTNAVDCVAAQNSGTPRARLANVLPCAAAGSSIWFRVGTYADNTQGLDSAAMPLVGGTDAAHPTIIGTLPSDRGIGQAILRSTTGGAFWFFHNSATDKFIQIQALTLDQNLAASSNTLVFYPGVHDISVSDSTIRYAGFEAVYINGATNITFTNTIVDTNTNAAVCLVGVANGANLSFIGSHLINGAKGGYCTYTEGANNTHIERTQVHNNGGVGIQLLTETNAFIVNNLIYTNTGGGISLGSGVGNLELYNNTFWSNIGGTGIAVAAGATSTVRNNIIFGFATPVSGTISVATDNVTANPSFVSPGPPSTFHVQGSNVIAAATVSPLVVSTDYNGNSRDVPYTIGAFEDQAVGTVPGVTLTATPGTITAGGSSTLSWTGSNVTSCSAPWTGSTATSGSQSVSPTITTTYTITCTDGATNVQSQATVTVTGSPSVSLTATPPSITAGGSSTLSWTGSNVTSCSAPWTGSTATSGSQSVSPTVTTTYTITCTNGTVNAQNTATVTILAAQGPTVRIPPYGSTGAPLFSR